MKNKYLMLIRHFETFQNSNKKEKLKYEESTNKAILFVNFINAFIKKYPEIKKIKFYTSDHERTMLTSLILSNAIKVEMLKKNFPELIINEPIIYDVIDRDPKKKNKKKTCSVFKKIIDKYSEDTLHIYITHSSIIYNLFKCILEHLLDTEMDDFAKRIHNYSISCISKIDDKVSYVFNKKIDK